jgi:hypothetical protein
VFSNFPGYGAPKNAIKNPQGKIKIKFYLAAFLFADARKMSDIYVALVILFLRRPLAWLLYICAMRSMCTRMRKSWLCSSVYMQHAAWSMEHAVMAAMATLQAMGLFVVFYLHIYHTCAG